jgi:hypothetical protein
LASDRRTPITLEEPSLESILLGVRLPSTIGEKIDALVSLLASRAGTDYLRSIPFNAFNDWPLVGVEGIREIEGVIFFAVELGLIRKDALSLTLHGWQRAEALRSQPVQSRRVFVAMSFSADLTSVWERGLVPGIERSGYFTAHRVDSEHHNEKIGDRIIAEIRRSTLVVADFTEHKAGVYFEAGYALGLGRPVIWTCRKEHISKAHFDTRQYNHITWASADELADLLDARISALYLPPGYSK